MVHYGTANDASRALTIDALNKDLENAFPDCKVSEAYSSKIIINTLKKRGIHKDDIQQALKKIHQQGYKKVIIQTSDLLDGVMTALIGDAVQKVKADFDTICIGKPLLWGVNDCKWMVKVLTSHITTEPMKTVVLVGHGTDGPANAIYSQLDYMLHDQGYNNYHVATIEGYPNLDNIKKILAINKGKHIILYPLLMIAGNHAVNDIQGIWKQKLTTLGYDVEVWHGGLATLPEVKNHIISQIQEMNKTLK